MRLSAADFRMRLMQGKSSKQLVRAFCNDPLYFALFILDADALVLRSLYTLVWLIALPFVLLRLVYIALYIGDKATARSLVWGLAVAVNIAILFAGYR